jgi:restriction system protein
MGTNRPKDRAQFVSYFGPLLDALRGLGGSARPMEATERIAEDLGVSQGEQEELLDSGSPRFYNAVQWARFYLVREGLIDGSTRGVWTLTPLGARTHLTLDESHAIFLKWVEVYAKARKERGKEKLVEEEDIDESEVAMPDSYRVQVAQLIKSMSPGAFERLCQRLLRESGFVSVQVTGRSGDGGIDGVGHLQVNPFVSFRVLFQCKRYAGSVSPSVVRDFRGAMTGRADKGIIITTGTFTTEAKKEAYRDGAPPLELVDGDKLVEMFEQLEFGLRPIKSYEVDVGFFQAFETEANG